MVKFQCFNCQNTIEHPSKEVGRREECHHCGADLHACKNCRFYDENSYNECLETSADVVKEKDRSNFCDFFEINTKIGAKSEKDDLRAAAEALFKK